MRFPPSLVLSLASPLAVTPRRCKQKFLPASLCRGAGAWRASGPRALRSPSAGLQLSFGVGVPLPLSKDAAEVNRMPSCFYHHCFSRGHAPL